MPEIELDEEALADFLEAEMTTTETGLQYVIETEGTGSIPETGQVVQVHYTGKLADGTVFDSSYERDQLLRFHLDKDMLFPVGKKGLD